jgi:DNA adenine methylase
MIAHASTPRSRFGITPRPFLKWVGGKGQLLDILRQRYLEAGSTGRYHEPFLGGGALFFDLARLNRLGRRLALLSDNNPRLIEAYLGVRDHLDEVIALLQEHKRQHSESYYYAVRAQTPARLAERAARVIYLNKTCYNGLWRENSRGENNVPIGRYRNPPICDEPNLRAVAKALRHAKIEQRHFRTVLRHARPGDFVYFDPPYAPLTATSNFTAYHADSFGEADQRELAEVYAELTRKGVKALLSNSSSPLIRKLYEPFTIEKVFAARNVNARADRRGQIAEVLVRNF